MSDKQMPATPLKVPEADPFNIQAVKRYVFNETGNIMMASTEIGSEQIQQEVRDLFAEVSVFFAAMTRAMSSTINPITKAPYSIYDYTAIEGIVDGSGLFVHVSEEDITHTISSWGVTVSKELIEGLLGLATGSGELAFAQGLISSIGKQGLKISGKSDKEDGRVGTIFFVCEYLLGMPIISALVCYVDSKAASQSFQLGPCISEQSQSLHLTMHKDTYLFVSPKFIKNYAGDLLSIESDLEYLELVDYLQDLVAHKPIVTAVVSDKGDPALSALTANKTYHILGAFLTKIANPVPNTKATYTVEFDGGEKIAAGNPQSNIVSFTPTQAMSKPALATIYVTQTPTSGKATKTAIATTPTAYTVVIPTPPNTPTVTGIKDPTGAPLSGSVLTNGKVYTIVGSNLLGGKTPASITVVTSGASGSSKVALSGTPTDSAVSFKVNATFSTKLKINIMSGSTLVVSAGKFTAT